MEDRRRTIQTIAALVQNANFKGFFTGKIYEGPVKQVCVPGLNCYSCPGAVGSCPVGSLQNALSSIRFHIPYYVIGLMIFFGTLLGRVVCGFLCPFGFLQDLLNKIPFPKKIKEWKYDKEFRYIKYAVLILLVIVLPIMHKLTPFYCKYLCPSGTIAGILLSINNTAIASMLGRIFTWKVIVLAAIIIFSMMIYRPFCKYLCPLGAFYGLFNKAAFWRMEYDESHCSRCMACKNICGMNVNPTENVNSAECIRCGKCIRVCPNKALSCGLCTEKRDEIRTTAE